MEKVQSCFADKELQIFYNSLKTLSISIAEQQQQQQQPKGTKIITTFETKSKLVSK